MQTDVSLRQSVVLSPLFKLATGFLGASTIGCTPSVLMSGALWQPFGLPGVHTGRTHNVTF